MKQFLVFYALLVVVFGRQGFGPTDQEWGFVTVREGAHMFWWLHYTTQNVTSYADRPLIIWLQGGPGGSSTQYGNFNELGPLDADLNPRNTTWVDFANVMFVDNPVGTGFSYVDNDEFTTNNTQIAKDFVVLLQGFYKDLPQFETTPLYIFCESYGGKMTAEIALYLDQAIKAGNIKNNFTGVGLGDSWISPVDSCLTWAPYLYSLGVLDSSQYALLNDHALELKDLVDAGEWERATTAFMDLEGYVDEYTNNVDYYNVLTPIVTNDFYSFWTSSKQFRHLYKPGSQSDLTDDYSLMKQVQLALNISNSWGKTNDDVFTYLQGDFMKPVTNIVERLLNETDLTVAVYNGQLDLIVDTPGTIDWVDKLNFKGSEEWTTVKRDGFAINRVYEGYEKIAGKLQFYWVLRSGHMVPKDNPTAMLYILQQVARVLY